MSLIKALILGVSITFAAANAHAGEPTQIEKNKATVVTFYNKALNDKDVEAAIALMGPTWDVLQHIPENIPHSNTMF